MKAEWNINDVRVIMRKEGDVVVIIHNSEYQEITVTINTKDLEPPAFYRVRTIMAAVLMAWSAMEVTKLTI